MVKVATRRERYPRRWDSKLRSVSLCDENGIVWAQVSISETGLTISHLEGARVQVNQMNGMGQHQLEGEPEKSFSCPSCGDFKEIFKPGRYHGPWDGREAGQVVCKSCGSSFFPEVEGQRVAI